MIKPLILVIILWILLFAFRVTQIGGLDPLYRESGSEILKPLQESLSATIDKVLPYPQSTILSGILLGNGKRIPFYLNKDLKATSTIHMVVVSGQNLSILAGFLMGFVYLIGRRKTIVLTCLAIICYSLLTGLGVPVIRAAVMVSLTYLAQLLGKDRYEAWILFLTAGLMLLWNPNWLMGISFQLSFLATFGVVVVAPIFVEFFKKAPNILRQDLAVTLAAQLLVLPIIVYNFGQLSLVGILANIFTLWTIPIIMVTGFTTLILGLFNNFLGQIIGLIPGILLTYYIYVVQFFAKVPGASLSVGEGSVIIWVGYYLMLGAAVWMLQIKSSKHKDQSLIKS